MKYYNTENIVYEFDLSEANANVYIPLLSELFRSEKWQEATKKRNHLAKQFVKQQGNLGIFKSLESIEDKMAKTLFCSLIEYAKSVHRQETSTTADILRSDSLTPEKREEMLKVMHDLDALLFLNDIMQYILNQTLVHLHKIDKNYNIPELEGIKGAIDAMSNWSLNRRRNEGEKQQELFNEYADSIERYLMGRVHTFLQKMEELRQQDIPLTKTEETK